MHRLYVLLFFLPLVACSAPLERGQEFENIRIRSDVGEAEQGRRVAEQEQKRVAANHHEIETVLEQIRAVSQSSAAIEGECRAKAKKHGVSIAQPVIGATSLPKSKS